MRTRTVCAACFAPADAAGHADPIDASLCMTPLPLHTTDLRVCDIGICDRLADVLNIGGHALCSGHAYGSLVVKPHTMTGRAL